MPALRLVVVLLALAGFAPAVALAQDEPVKERDQPGEAGSALEQAREEAGEPPRAPSSYALPGGGTLRVAASELLAAAVGRTIRFEATLARPRPGAALRVELPAAWVRTPASGIRATKAPRAGRGDRLGRSGRAVTLRFRAGERQAAFSVRNAGIPAGTYELPVRFTPPGGPARELAPVRVNAYASVRESRDEEAAANPWRELPRAALNASSDAAEQSETSVAVAPGDPDRFAVGINGPQMEAYVTEDGGATFAGRVMPTSTDAPGGGLPEASDICCDPMFAAGDAGDLWFGGLTLEGAAPSRIVVNRIAAGGTTFQPLTVGLPSNGTGTQDKPLMTIDNGAASPHHGRLYVVWDEPAGAGVRVVLSHCDTLPDVAACDDADGWSAPVPVTPASGSFIYADVATAPDGRLYVTWWDYSNVNAIVGKVSADGGATFGATQTIAQLDKNGAGEPLPFGCPILVQPGGRVGPVPGVEVDGSGRVYVSWGDLRPGSGTTRCEMDASGDFTPPRTSHLSWDAFVASAAGRLPGGAGPSAAVGTRLHADGTEGLAASADDFFPWLAVDPGTGAVWADFYSTGHDPARRSAHFYAVAVEPTASGHRIGRLNRLSAAPSSYYSADPADCCQFQNDFGDYEGIAAAGGRVVPSWSDNSSGTRDGEAYVWTGALSTAPPAATPTPTPTPTPGPSATSAPTASPPPSPTSTPAPTRPRGGLGDLDVESRQLLSTVLRRGVRAEVFCLRACTATTTLTVDARTARRYHVPRRVGRLRRALPGGRYRTVRVKLGARARRGLRRARRVKVVVRASVGRVAAGEVGAMTARVALERRRR